jgi:hypothetical protein
MDVTLNYYTRLEKACHKQTIYLHTSIWRLLMLPRIIRLGWKKASHKQNI